MDLPEDIESLKHQVTQGRDIQYLFFWGHQPRSDGRIGPSCLSQWWESPFTLSGRVYRTAEHYMMAEKGRLFGDTRAVEDILAATSPKEAKEIGRSVTGYQEPLWEEHRVSLVVRGNVAKFSQNPELGAFLVGTRPFVLVEASPHDRVWGIGLRAADPRVADPALWRGRNLLGFALMKVRSEIQRSAIEYGGCGA